jgi:hypothetical protein
VQNVGAKAMPAIISGESAEPSRSRPPEDILKGSFLPSGRPRFETFVSFSKNPVRWLSVKAFRQAIEETGPPSTFIRLLSSDHLNDLQWIGLGAIVLWAIFIALLLTQANSNTNLNNHLSSVFDYFINQHAIFGGITAVLGLVLNWIYQTGSKRLGVVDLFACEISAICRVSLAVDFARSCVSEAEKDLVH